eukprot:336184_1
MPLENLFIDPVPPTRNDPANYRRAAFFFFVVLPILFCLYLEFGDRMVGPQMRYEKWNKSVKHDLVVQISEINSKEFEWLNPITNKLENMLISRDSDTCSSDNLDILLLDNGLNIKDERNIDYNTKKDLLLKIASPDFWRMNYMLHPKRKRVTHWILTHKYLLQQIESLKQLNNIQTFKIEFIKFKNILMNHLEFDNLMLYKFWGDDIGMDIIAVLRVENDNIHKETVRIETLLETDKKNVEIMDEMEKYEKTIMNHFKKEEREIVYEMLNLENWLYRRYRSILSWKYYWKTTS